MVLVCWMKEIELWKDQYQVEGDEELMGDLVLFASFFQFQPSRVK